MLHPWKATRAGTNLGAWAEAWGGERQQSGSRFRSVWSSLPKKETRESRVQAAPYFHTTCVVVLRAASMLDAVFSFTF